MEISAESPSGSVITRAWLLSKPHQQHFGNDNVGLGNPVVDALGMQGKHRSVVVEGDTVFRWRYLRGVLAPFENATTPRNFNPCRPDRNWVHRG